MAFNDETLPALKKEVDKELRSILSWWKQHAIDKKRGGFYGSVNNGNTPDATAPKGVVMTSRVLWAFSAAYTHTNDPGDLLMATRAWEYLRDHFIDKRHGGVYWSVDANGDIHEDRKQIYGPDGRRTKSSRGGRSRGRAAVDVWRIARGDGYRCAAGFG